MSQMRHWQSGLSVPKSAMNRQRHCLEFTADRIMVRLRSVLAEVDRLPTLMGLISLAVLAQVKREYQASDGGQLDPKKDVADDDRCGGSWTSHPRICIGRHQE